MLILFKIFGLDATPESVGEDAAKELIEDCNSGSCIDRHVQDQVSIFQ